jgi:hypothetical protein
MPCEAREQQPVVILNTGLHADDHQDLAFKPQPNVILLRDLATITPENGLHWQGAVIARREWVCRDVWRTRPARAAVCAGRV